MCAVRRVKHALDSVADIDQIFELVLSAGAILAKSPQKVTWGGHQRKKLSILASCINYPPQSVFAAQKALFLGQNGVWLNFTPGEVKPHGKITSRMW